mmetsp:Transcript_27100/g.37397  ORF Transcript_27100/g.37397 Transcript_27100/m.37397 type:complete len:217 (+) Transcript_27100:435-1085(+)
MGCCIGCCMGCCMGCCIDCCMGSCMDCCMGCCMGCCVGYGKPCCKSCCSGYSISCCIPYCISCCIGYCNACCIGYCIPCCIGYCIPCCVGYCIGYCIPNCIASGFNCRSSDLPWAKTHTLSYLQLPFFSKFIQSLVFLLSTSTFGLRSGAFCTPGSILFSSRIGCWSSAIPCANKQTFSYLQYPLFVKFAQSLVFIFSGSTFGFSSFTCLIDGFVS